MRMQFSKVICVMIDKQNQLKTVQQAGIAVIKQIDFKNICEMMSYHHPPKALFAVLQSVQIVLAGNFSEIEMNPATNEPKANDWYACRKMACKDPLSFLRACCEIFDKFGKDSFLQGRVQSAIKHLYSSEIGIEKMKNVSMAGQKLYVWMQQVEKYKQLIRQQ